MGLITPEFYLSFWEALKGPLMECLFFNITSGSMSPEQRRGIICLIPKKSKDRLLIQNWRPITLLNTDYKIYTKLLARRLTPLLPTLIHPNQTGFVKNRFIGENVRTTEDVIEYCLEERRHGFVCSLDVEKAFDTVAWSAIRAALFTLGFPHPFIHMIMLIFKDVETRVSNFGHVSSPFFPSRGVRQGCCVSPFLFICVVELIANRIREAENIRGIRIGDTECKITLYADDITCYLRDPGSIEAVFEQFEAFQSFAGLKLSGQKSEVLPIGSTP